MEIEPGISNDYLPMDPKRLLERMHTALNTRDLTNLLKCLQVDYEEFNPNRPKSNTIGLEAAREEWDRIFTIYPNFQADLLHQAIESNTIWAEWRWTGSQEGRPENDMRRVGVIIYGVEQGLFAWSRIFMVDERSDR